MGNQDTTETEWLSNVKRDTYYSLLGHASLLEYTTLAKNQQSLNENNSSINYYTKRQMKWELLNKMGHSGNYN